MENTEMYNNNNVGNKHTYVINTTKNNWKKTLRDNKDMQTNTCAEQNTMEKNERAYTHRVENG